MYHTSSVEEARRAAAAPNGITNLSNRYQSAFRTPEPVQVHLVERYMTDRFHGFVAHTTLRSHQAASRPVCVVFSTIGSFGLRLMYTPADVGAECIAKIFIDQVEVEPLRIEMSARPAKMRLVVFMLRVADRLEEFSV